MLSKRKLLIFKRVFRNQTLLFVIFGIFLVSFLFYVSTYDFTESLKNAQPKELVSQFELPGKPDPLTIFVDGKLGNFESVINVENNYGPGKNGEAVFTDSESPEVIDAISKYGFNVIASDKISLNRSLPDVRMNECKYWHYPTDLPTVSVIIAFHNEAWTPLLRTVNSVLLRSPPNLLKEIILVDDFSDNVLVPISKLKKYIKQFGERVKLIQNTEREGLIRTRTNGALAANGDVLVFLDAHCEVNYNWLPPLLAPIKNNKKVMTVPIIDGIDQNTWAYHRVYGDADLHYRGIFEWGLLYKETKISQKEEKERLYKSQPFRSPTHAGGLFAIHKDWFAKLGYYDSGLQIWGGEQYELSFKIWQCGGGILFVPCSHVGHVYRHHMPYKFGKLTGKNIIATNMIRVIKTWMDDYAKYYYIREPQNKYLESGDLSIQFALKEKLQCKSFKWYMDKVAYDVLENYPFPPENDVWGEAKNPSTGKCIDATGKIHGYVQATPCHGYGGNQLIRLNKKGQLAQGEWCITPSNTNLIFGYCKDKIKGPFKYEKNSNQIIEKNSNRCLTVHENSENTDLTLKLCEKNNKFQKFEWTVKYYN